MISILIFAACFFPGDLSSLESSELEQERKRQQLQETALMPLPDSGADGPLDWAHLVDAAKAFEGRHMCLHFLLEKIGSKGELLGREIQLKSVLSPEEGTVALCRSIYSF